MTDRLILRRFEETDYQAAYDNWMSDPDVTEFLTWDAHSSPKVSLAVIREWVEAYQYGSMDWCITLRSNREPIGGITAVQDFPSKRYCELGYCLSQRYWNKGLMQEALSAVVRYIFENTNYLWIQARYDIENEASGRCLENCGFREMYRFEEVLKGTTIESAMMRIDRP